MAPSSLKKSAKQLGAPAKGVSLPIDALALVADYAAPRELFHLTFTCKSLMERLTVAQVVKSALYYGGDPQATIDQLFPLLKKQQIHPVSALRLLRLIHARRCESCGRAGVHPAARERYGVAFCRDCVDQTTWGSSLFSYPFFPRGDGSHDDDDPYAYEKYDYWERLYCIYRESCDSFSGWNRHEPFVQTDGTPAGPIFTVNQVCDAYYGVRQWRIEDGEFTARQLETYAMPEEDRMRILLERNLPDDPDGTYDEFVRTYKKFRGKADEWHRVQETKRKREERAQKRVAKLKRDLSTWF